MLTICILNEDYTKAQCCTSLLTDEDIRLLLWTFAHLEGRGALIATLDSPCQTRESLVGSPLRADC